MSKEGFNHRGNTKAIREKLAKDKVINAHPTLRYGLFEILAVLDELSRRVERFENAELETEG